jgi:hypothetical protein
MKFIMETSNVAFIYVQEFYSLNSEHWSKKVIIAATSTSLCTAIFDCTEIFVLHNTTEAWTWVQFSGNKNITFSVDMKAIGISSINSTLLHIKIETFSHFGTIIRCLVTKEPFWATMSTNSSAYIVYLNRWPLAPCGHSSHDGTAARPTEEVQEREGRRGAQQGQGSERFVTAQHGA